MTLVLGVLAFAAARLAPADDRGPFFEKHIRPVMLKECSECHTGRKPDGDFRIEGLDHLLKGGKHGPAIVPGKPEESLFVKLLESTDEDKRMPPEEPLSAQAIADFKQWIRDGAIWPDGGVAWTEPTEPKKHWSFQPVAEVDPPAAVDASWCRTPIDAFVQAEQQRRGVRPVAAADKRTLLRRVTFDLTGLPPTPDEMRAFLDDTSPSAFEHVVNRLLDSRAYGERWGRHWLDLARYADTSGDGTDTPIPEARYYRDYVIAAFQHDLPFDQFLVEQLAGDILAKQSPDHPRANDQIIATGYIALSRRYGNSRGAEQELILDDTIDTIGRSLLGLSLSCVRCHHHKFDPITMEDYYGLHGYFSSTLYPHAGTEHQKERADFVALRMDEAAKARFDSPLAWAVSDKPKGVGDSRVHLAGDPRKPGAVAPRGFLDVIDSRNATIAAGSSGRLELAKWIASADNPLTARVLVNRVWQHHFGKGLVATPSEFGVQGARPTHPELLDWLARDLVQHGWSVKHLHRRIVLSATYQLSSVPSAEQVKKDEANVSYGRFDRQRLDAESIRDALLFVSGTLEPGDGGRHPFPPTEKLKYTQSGPFAEIYDHQRRSVYLMMPRLNKHPFLALFDGPDTNKSTPQRGASTVALQALFLMNSPIVKQQAAAFARRVLRGASARDDQIARAYELALCRPPTETERQEAAEYVASLESTASAEQAWTSLARVLFSSNEFLYVD